ncbi:alpha/beta fold hydrolase [Kineosporia succinea]|uniref:Pimeloyl-ACP methyl ester carboxylesterase n=1 Tax=Kineosporia succinea TaxID=84632 RepID=A0ABT9PCS2_9ACTN|nr:alpha/beta hydrolase [Kineosporia succinea]MDP9830512.1 pimeloyl-ACP methyl ester carboxylesterase [Kineosporia succinea]
MSTYVLVPGFFFGPWVWEETGRVLREAGHEVRIVALTGQGSGSTEGVGVETHVADILGRIDEDVVLVLHSGATIAGTAAADRVPGKLRHLVYVDTAPFPDGMAQIEFLPPEVQAAQREQIRVEGHLPPPAFDDPSVLGGLTPDDLERMRRLATAQPAPLVLEPARRPDPVPATPRTLIASSFSVDQVRAMVDAGVPAFSMLAGPGWTMLDLPTGHWPMLSRPGDLAGMLRQI